MSCENETAATLRAAGQKITPQRLLILSAVRHRAEHVTAAEVLDDVRRVYPYVDISTVYRTLGAAKDMHLVSETPWGAGDMQFEWGPGHEDHHHLICRKCGQVQILESKQLDGLLASSRDGHGFKADLEHLAVFGICKSCLTAET